MSARALARPVVVAIDGPAGSGKSSVSKAAARALDYDYQDTGAAYRALAWYALDTGIDTDDPAAVVASLASFDYRLDPDTHAVLVGGVDVSAAIREPRVTDVVSAVARIPEVRTFLVELFRSTIVSTERSGIVTEGRDITTVVAPDADVRILLTASEAARQARRSGELSGTSASEAAAKLTSRDAQDSRVVDFMNAAPGVTLLDSTDLDFAQTVAAVVSLVEAAQRS